MDGGHWAAETCCRSQDTLDSKRRKPGESKHRWCILPKPQDFRVACCLPLFSVAWDKDMYLYPAHGLCGARA